MERPGNDVITARLHAIAAPKAGLWLTTIPMSSQLRITNEAFQNATRLRLGLPPTEYPPSRCAKCSSGDFQADAWHALACGSLRGSTHTNRHNKVVRLLSQWINRLGGISHIEPRNLDRDSERRPDIDASLGGKRFLIDVTILHPTARSNVADGARGPLALARSAAQEKSEKYAPMARHNKATFVPFAVETYGGICDEANDFVRDLIKMAGTFKFAWQPSEVVYTIRHSIAMAVQNGNAEAVSRCLIGVLRD